MDDNGRMILPIWAVAFALGVAFACFSGGAPTWALLAILGMVAAWGLRRRSALAAGAAIACAVGALLARGALVPVPPSASAVRALDDGGPVLLRGRVTRGPIVEPASGRARIWLALESIGGAAAGERVAVSLAGTPAGVAPGDRVELSATLREPVTLANPGLPDPVRAARLRDFELAASGKPASVRLVEPGRWWGARRLAHRVRVGLAAAIDERLPPAVAPFVRGVVLGDRGGMGEQVESDFRAAGATHVLSVSGLHLTAVSGMAFLLVRRLVLLSSWLALRINSSAVAAALSIPVVALYTLVTGAAVATVRSALMAVVVLLGVVLVRAPCLATSVAGAALGLLVHAPLTLFDVSFQLSFASVIALGLWARDLERDAAPRGVVARASAWLRAALLSSAAASVATAPLVAHHFGVVTPAAPLGNLVLVPLVELAVVPAGLLGAALGALHPALGAPLELAGWASRGALLCARAFGAVAPVLSVRAPSVLETWLLTAGAGALLLSAHARGSGRRAWRRVAAVAVAAALVGLGGREAIRRASRALTVTFLDVGQGDAALLEGPGGLVVLIDGGGSHDGGFDPGERVIGPVLRAKGISRIDLVVLSHPHPDHLNGLLYVLQTFEIGALWTNGDDGNNPTYVRFMAEARRRGVRTPVPDRVERRGVIIEPLGPWSGERIAAPPGLSVNDASLVLRIGFGGRWILFGGDLEEDGEAELVGRASVGLSVRADVLKVPHHGSRTSSSAELLDAVRPELAVISLGWRNRFRFPHGEVLRRYEARQVRISRTDLLGAITLRVSRDGRIEQTCARGCR